MRKVLFFFATLTFFNPHTVMANDTAFGGTGATPMPIKQTGVAMLAEKIVITGSDIDREDMRGKWEYNCDYTFKNITNKTLNFQMGFPFPVNDELGETTVPEGFERSKDSPLVYDFKATINSKPIEATITKITPLPGTDYKEAYIWPMSIKPYEKVKIHHDYLTGVTFNVAGQHWVSFVLKTGALWKGGKIDSAKFEVSPNTPTLMCTEVDPTANYLKPKPSGIKVIGFGKDRKYEWDLKDFKPTEDLELCLMTGKKYVRYYIVYPIIQGGTYNNVKINLNDLSTEQLQILRNSIYAQYGKSFENAKLQEYYNKQWWYQPNPNYDDSMLTQDDKKAIAAIAGVENSKQ